MNVPGPNQQSGSANAASQRHLRRSSERNLIAHSSASTCFPHRMELVVHRSRSSERASLEHGVVSDRLFDALRRPVVQEATFLPHRLTRPVARLLGTRPPRLASACKVASTRSMQGLESRVRDVKFQADPVSNHGCPSRHRCCYANDSRHGGKSDESRFNTAQRVRCGTEPA